MMLYKYKESYKKIAMGLLSFIPDLKELSHLQEVMDWYAQGEERQLYLWQNDHGDFAGVVGVEVAPDLVLVREIAVSPAQRQEGVTYLMLDELEKLYQRKLMGSIEVGSLITKWEQRKNG